MLLLSVSFVLLSIRCDGYKFLIYSPQIGHSHVAFFGQIADALVDAGHDALLYVPSFFENVKTTAAKRARILERPLDYKLPYTMGELLSDAWTEDGGGIFQIFKVMIGAISNIKLHCDMQLADKKLMDKLREERFDVGITETFNMCGYAIFDKIGIRTHISAFATNLVDVFSYPFGVANNPSYVPGTFTQLSDVMSYGQRWQNVASYAALYLMCELFYRPILKFEGVAPGFSLDDIIPRSVFVFVNSEEFLEYPRPISHKVVFVGGIGVTKPKPLAEEYKRIMDNAKGAVVLISFGSIAKSSEMPSNIKDAFVGMFAQLPEVTFIWKYEVDDDIGANFTNVIKKKWVPQNDLFDLYD
ncbi:Putative UDP-glucuronosyltransferase ugt-55 [Toxocara canis]|uniref:glucuronosyltransferase n=1 Tax=Toxocara canis TaxID=6265 RepID=A0A0B2VZ59_TOXCA|nr:Putative UDP-glucuronosyltransferase ugt-55 [Toxocara canis]